MTKRFISRHTDIQAARLQMHAYFHVMFENAFKSIIW
jgi:hypothetical protein